RHSTAGWALTVTFSPPSETERVSVVGAGSSQNQEAAPVSPLVGEVWIAPGRSGSRAATDAASAAGLTAATGAAPPPGAVPAGETTRKQGVALSGRYWQAWPDWSTYQNDPGPSGAGFRSSGE